MILGLGTVSIQTRVKLNFTFWSIHNLFYDTQLQCRKSPNRIKQIILNKYITGISALLYILWSTLISTMKLLTANETHMWEVLIFTERGWQLLEIKWYSRTICCTTKQTCISVVILKINICLEYTYVYISRKSQPFLMPMAAQDRYQERLTLNILFLRGRHMHKNRRIWFFDKTFALLKEIESFLLISVESGLHASVLAFNDFLDISLSRFFNH